MGTLLAVIVFFKDLLKGIIDDVRDVCNKKLSFGDSRFKLVIFVVIAFIPAVVVVMFFEKIFSHAFSSVKITAWLLIVNGVILLISFFCKNNEKGVKEFNLLHAILIGLTQCLAIFPGISRSGTTISCALWCGIKPQLAFQFSFLLAIPAILGALIYDIKEVLILSNEMIFIYIMGLAIAAIVGYISLIVLRKFVIKNKLYVFSIYCWIIGIIFLVIK